MRSKDTSARTLGLIGFSIFLHGAAFWTFNENLTLKQMAQIIEETKKQAGKSQWDEISQPSSEIAVITSAEMPIQIEEETLPSPKKIEPQKVVKKAKQASEISTELPKKAVIEKVSETSIPAHTVTVDHQKEPEVRLIPVSDRLDVDIDIETEAYAEIEKVPKEIKEIEETDLLSELKAAEEKPSTLEKIRSYLGLKQVDGNQPPQYPLEARKQGLQGRVLLKYFVTEKGDVEDIVITESSGYKVLDEAALQAISSYRFYPGQEGWAEHPVKFSLKGLRDEISSDLGAFKN